MLNNLLHTIRYKIDATVKRKIFDKKQKALRGRILTYYDINQTNDAEIRQAIDYLSKHTLSTFYGNFQDKYTYKDITVETDAKNGLPYVLTDNKKLYFKRSQNKRTIQLMFNGLRIEQDKEAPHCYVDEKFDIADGDILADVGCAEAYFSLLNIEKLRKLYLFEQDKAWIEALEATFKPWKEKVTIVPKFVSDKNSETETKLDDFFRPQSLKPNFYKIDVEGAEASVLRGMKEILPTKPLKIALCTYHHQEDFEKFSHFFEEQGFQHRPNAGLMIYQNDMETMQPPYFRKCLIKAERK